MSKPTKGNIKGAQQHAEGQQHGDKTFAANKARINNEGVEPTVNNDSSAGLREANDPNHREKRSDHSPDGEREFAAGVNTGKHKLFEDRQQHDEADKNSEKNRSDRVNSPIDQGRAGERQHQ
jgi:hypothetical protein